MESLESRQLLAVDFPDFGAPVGLNLSGTATTTDGVLRLAPLTGGAGSAWVAEQQFVSLDFQTTFQFQLGDGLGGPGGSDGFAFVIQNSDPNALGGGGGNQGYSNIRNSVAIEFDTFRNSEFDDPDQSHVSVQTRGTGPNSPNKSFSLGTFSTTASTLDDGNIHTARVEYSTSDDLLTIFLDDLGTPALTVPFDFEQTLELNNRMAWVGFTGATGGGPTNHDILNWEFTSAADTSPVLAIDNLTELEGSGGGTSDFVFTVQRIGDAAGAASVNYATVADSATSPEEFAAASGTVNFPAGVTEQTVTVSVVRDNIEEPAEVFFVELSNASGAGLGDSRARATILNDETSITVRDQRGREDDDTAIPLGVFVDEQQLPLGTGLVFGPDGDLYVASPQTDEILRFDGTTGESLGVFVAAGSGGLDVPAITSLLFRPDGNLYVPGRDSHNVLRYNGTTGAFIDEFVTAGSGGLDRPKGMVFGPDGNLYVGSSTTDEVLRYNGTTGAFVDVFVSAQSGGLQEPRGLAFGPGGDLFVADQFGNTVLRYDGLTGDFMEAFVPQGDNGLRSPSGLLFDAAGKLYVTSAGSGEVLIYEVSSGEFVRPLVPSSENTLLTPRDLTRGPNDDLFITDRSGISRFSVKPQLGIPVQLSFPMGEPVTVDFATADGTAIAGADYTATTGTVTFAAGETEKTVIVPLNVTEPVNVNKTFTVTLSNPAAGATIADGQATGTIIDQNAPPTVVTDTSPAGNARAAAATTDVCATLDRPVFADSVTPSSFAVHSTQRGQLTEATSTTTVDSQTIAVDPTSAFFPGELVQATVTSNVESLTAGSATPHVFQFRTATTTGSGLFSEAQQFGNQESFDVALGDLDGDGDLDAFVANGSPSNNGGVLPNRVWFNTGGSLSDSGQVVGDRNSRGVSLGDLDGDGDLDAFVVNTEGNRAWLNDGAGNFSDTGQQIGESGGRAARLADFDGDGDLDVVVAKSNSDNRVWLNDGAGNFSLGDSLGLGSIAEDVTVGDVDGDGDLDVLFGESSFPSGKPNQLWLNDGNAQFTLSGSIGSANTGGIALGDLDGDGDLDAFEANIRFGNRIWLNNGLGQFTDSGQLLGDDEAEGVVLGDLDADGDLDAVVANFILGSDRVWINDGSGRFTDSGQDLTDRPTSGLALGDLDNDGDLDVVTANNQLGNTEPNRVWLNQNPTEPTVTLSRTPSTIAEDGGVATFTATLAEATTVPVVVDLGFTGSATFDSDYSVSGTQITIASGTTFGSITVTAIDDSRFDPDETVTVDIVGALNATLIGQQRGTVTITDDDPVPPTVASVTPPANAPSADSSASILATFEEPINGATATTQTFAVHSSIKGRLQAPDAVITTDGPAVTIDPTSDFAPGELIRVTATSDVLSTVGPIGPYVWEFRAGVDGGSGLFENTNVLLGDQDSFATRLGDLDGDGDLDAFVANDFENRVWWNEYGTWVDSGQELGDSLSVDVELGDLDGDGDLDAFVGNFLAGERIWLNTGGQFTDSGQSLGADLTTDIALGDIDGDGDLDAISVNPYGSRLWLNDAGLFSESGQSLGNGFRVSLGDVDRDGDMDVVFVNNNGLQVFTNAGGLFTSGDILDVNAFSFELADFDADGDLDLFASAGVNGSQVWLNEGGTFTDSGQRLGDHEAGTVAIGDLDGDGDLDAIQASPYPGKHVWLNAGDGTFQGTGQLLGTTGSNHLTLGDVDGDGDLDVFASKYGGNEVWRNAPPGPAPEVTLAVEPTSITEDGGTSAVNLQLSAVAALPVTIQLEFTGTATPNEDFTSSATEIVIPPGSTSATLTVTAVQDAVEEEDETIVIDISSVSNGVEAGTQQATVTIVDVTPVLQVTSLTPTDAGFVADFNIPFDASQLNLYDTQSAGMGMADVTLTGSTTGPIAGSLMVDPAGQQVTFINTGAALPPDTYTVLLRSADNGFRDANGGLLDGNQDGAAGGDYMAQFTIDARPANTVLVTLPDFVRGPGQTVEVPATESGIPITISEGANLRTVELQVRFDPALLNVTGATVGAGMPAGTTITTDTATPGQVTINLTSTTPLPAGSQTVVNLIAAVPATDASGIYGQHNVVEITSAVLRDGNDNQLPAVLDTGVHLVGYFGDVSGNGRVNASDAAQVARFAALLETGFAISLLTDPMLLGDISGNQRVNAADASRVAQFAALIEVPEIPPIPPGLVIAASGFAESPATEVDAADERVADPVPALLTTSRAERGIAEFAQRVRNVDRLMERLSADSGSWVALEEVLDQLTSG